MLQSESIMSDSKIHEATSSTQRIHILVVEDDREIRAALAELLQDEGYVVEVAANGEKALERLRTFSPSACFARNR